MISNCFRREKHFLEASRLPGRNISRHFFITKLEVTITRGIHEAIANYAYLFFVTNNPQKGTAPGGFPWSPALFLTLFSTKKEYWHACFQERIHQHLFRHESHFNTRVCLTHQAHLYAELTFVLKGIVLVILGTWVSKEWCKRAYNTFSSLNCENNQYYASQNILFGNKIVLIGNRDIPIGNTENQTVTK